MTNILVVDDNEPFRRLVGSVLAGNEFQIVGWASDGLEAVRKAQELQPDLILLDIGLPKLNGIETARRISQLPLRSKIIFLSQETSPDVVAAALGRSASGYVSKLDAGRELVLAIRAVLRGELFVSESLKGYKLTGAGTRTTHEALFYSDDSVLIETAARFLAGALRADGAAILVATESHRAGVLEKLKSKGIDINDEIRRGTYVSLDAADMLSGVVVNGRLNRAAFAEGLRDGVGSLVKAARAEHPRVAMFGEGAGLLCALGNPDMAVDLEKVGNDFFRRDRQYSLDVLCAYPLTHWKEDKHAFDHICGEHSAVYFA